MKLYVLVTDVVGSSQAPNREDLTEKLQSGLQQVNEQFSEDLYADLEITRGDQMAAVLTTISNAYDILATLEWALYPSRFRAVISYGELTAGLDSGSSRIIDGPAFYAAHRMMRELKRSKKSFAISSSHEGELDEAAGVLVNLLQWRWNEMTDLQRRILRHYLVERNQLRVAELVGRSQQQVSHSLIATKWELINSSEASISHLFQLLDRRNQAAAEAEREELETRSA